MTSDEFRGAGKGSRDARRGGVPVFVFMFCLIMGTACVAAGVYNYYSGVRAREMFRGEVRNNVAMLAAGTEIRLAPLLVFNDRDGINKLMSEAFSFRVVVDDAFIVSADDGRILYDSGGSREGMKFDAGMLRRGAEMFVDDVEAPRGVGLAPPEAAPIAKLVVGYVLPEPVAYQHTKAIYDYSKAMFDEMSSIMDSGQFAQARAFLSNMILNNPETTGVQLIDDDGVVFVNLYQDRGGSVKSGDEGVRVSGDVARMTGSVSEKRLLRLERGANAAGKPVYEIYMPLLSGGERVGTIRIEYAIEDYVRGLERERRKRYYAIALFMAAAVSGAFFSSLWISAPVKRLAEAALRAGRGDLAQSVDIRHTGREIRHLADDFNEMVRLRAEAEGLLKSNEERLRQLSRRVISAQEEERASLGRELHDDFGHKFLTLSLKVEAMRRKGLISGPDADALDGLVQDTSSELMRIYRGLKPVVIERLGLGAAVEGLVVEAAGNPGLEVEADIGEVGRDVLDGAAALAVYRVAQESLSNVVRHAGASRVRVSLGVAEGRVRLEVEDNGCGIRAGADGGGGTGLVGMRERAHAAGGVFEVVDAPGGGTIVRLWVPVSGGARGGGVSDG